MHSRKAETCIAGTGFPGAFLVSGRDFTEKHHEFSWLMRVRAAILEGSERAVGREGRRGSSERRQWGRRFAMSHSGVLMEKTRPDLDQLLTTQQAAELLGLHPFTLHGWHCAGRRELPWYVIGGGRIRYRRGDVLDYIQRGLYGQGTVPARFK